MQFGTRSFGVPSHLVPRPLGTRQGNGGTEAGYETAPPELYEVTVIADQGGDLRFSESDPDDNRVAVIVQQFVKNDRKTRFTDFWCGVPENQLVKRDGTCVLLIMSPGDRFYFQASVQTRLPRSRASKFKHNSKLLGHPYSIEFDGREFLATKARISAPAAESAAELPAVHQAIDPVAKVAALESARQHLSILRDLLDCDLDPTGRQPLEDAFKQAEIAAVNPRWDSVQTAALTVARESVNGFWRISDALSNDGVHSPATELVISVQLETVRETLSVAIENAEQSIAGASESLTTGSDTTVFELAGPVQYLDTSK